MAEAFLDHPAGWKVITLEPRNGSGYIERVESGGTPSTSVDEYWDGWAAAGCVDTHLSF